jgi:hypothetical protein
MTTVQVTIPDDLAKEAAAEGLLETLLTSCETTQSDSRKA